MGRVDRKSLPYSTLSKCVERPGLPGLPPSEALLLEGGDTRIALSPGHGTNQYGCQPVPAPAQLAFGSATASVISGPAFAATERLRDRLADSEQTTPRPVTYARELNRIRRELIALCELSHHKGLALIFGASGTDLHLMTAQLVGGTAAKPTRVIMMDAAETGSSVPHALNGRHFNRASALGHAVKVGRPVGSRYINEVVNLPLRHDDGTPRPAAALDADVESLVNEAVAQGRRVLLNMVDVSKSGLIAPSPACLLALRRRMPQAFDVLVDACQFRLAPATLNAYLEQDCMVALTGSKFATGPAFSAALLVPPAVAARFRQRLLPRTLRAYSARADWPDNWVAGRVLDPVANYGLLLRWEAALEELRRFRAVPGARVTTFLQDFSQVVQQRLRNDPAFHLLAVHGLDRRPLVATTSWDHIQTLFPFTLSHPCGTPLTREESTRVYRRLRAEGCQLGQPVACGQRHGRPVSALRLCASARLIVEATAGRGEGSAGVIARALTVLDRVAYAVQHLSGP